MGKVSINNLAQYANDIDAKPQPTDMFEVKVTRLQLQWLRNMTALQIKSERAQLDYYTKRDEAKHPERKAMLRFSERLRTAKEMMEALDKARRFEQ